MRGITALNNYDLTDPVETGLSSNKQFLEIRAIRNFNGTLGDLEAYIFGKIDPYVLNVATNFYLAENMYANHAQDALEIEKSNRQKIAADKAKAKAQTKTR